MLLQINKLYVLKVVLKKVRVPLLLREGLVYTTYTWLIRSLLHTKN